MTAQNSFFGNVIGSANQPTFTAASGVWRPTDIARRLAFGPTVYKDGVWPLLNDANFGSVTLLSHFDNYQAISGTTQTTSNTGSVGGTLTLTGTGQISSAQSKFGPASLFVSLATAGGGRAKAVANTGYTFGTGDFTLEFWIFITVMRLANIMDLRTAANSVCPLIYTQTDSSVRYFVSNVDRINSGVSAITTLTWTHIALARSGTSTKLFVNGTQVGSTFTDSNNYTQDGVSFGNSNGALTAAGGDCYITEGRVLKGLALYTSNFTAPTARFADY